MYVDFVIRNLAKFTYVYNLLVVLILCLCDHGFVNNDIYFPFFNFFPFVSYYIVETSTVIMNRRGSSSVSEGIIHESFV